MKNNNSLYEFLYNSIITQIFVDSLKNGDQLPSMYQLSVEYDIGINTVRKALYKLQDDGYIKLTKGKCPIVNVENNDFYNKNINLLFYKKDSVIDLLNVNSLFISEWIVQGLMSMEKSQIEELRIYFEQINIWTKSPQEIYLTVFSSIKYILSCFNNSLLTNLYINITNYIKIPYLNNETVIHPFFRDLYFIKNKLFKIIELSKEKEYLYLKNRIKNSLEIYSNYCDEYLGEITKSLTSSNTKIDFNWVTKVKKSYIYPKIAANIINDIFLNIYKNEELLPLSRYLEKKYLVSLNTIQKVIYLLNDIGIIRPIKGTGALITLNNFDINNVKINDFFIKKDLFKYLCANQIICLTIKQAILLCYSYIPYEEFNDLKNSFELNDLNLSIKILDFVIKYSPCNSIRIIYKQIKYYIEWHYFIISISDMKFYIEYFFDLYKNIIKSIENYDINLFASDFEEFYFSYFKLVKNKLIDIGVEDAKLLNELKIY